LSNTAETGMKFSKLCTVAAIAVAAGAANAAPMSVSVGFAGVTASVGASLTRSVGDLDFVFTGDNLFTATLTEEYVRVYGPIRYLGAGGFLGPLTITMSETVAAISVFNPFNGTDGRANARITIRGYDAAARLLGGLTGSAETITFAAAGLRSIVLTAPSTGFVIGGAFALPMPVPMPVPVPLPAPAALLLAALALIGAVARRGAVQPAH
jgi:hypothetical protein